MNTRVIEAVVRQHAEEAAFLWMQRAAAVSAPHYALRHLARLDERVAAHIDGLQQTESGLAKKQMLSAARSFDILMSTV